MTIHDEECAPECHGEHGPVVYAYVGLGSNQGDSLALLEEALRALAGLPMVLAVDKVSSVYRTEPQGYRDQPLFFNQVARLVCAASLKPLALLDSLLAVEKTLGRVRPAHVEDAAARFGPRPIDLDLLLFGNTRMKGERLTLPHPRMTERAFVLLPLGEIAPDITLAGGGTVTETLRNIPFVFRNGTLYQ